MNNKQTLGDRVNQVFEYYKENVAGFQTMGKSDFAKIWDIEYRNLANYMTEKSEMRIDTIRKFINAFPIIDIDWFITGRGSMLKFSNEKTGKVSDKEVPYSGMSQKNQEIMKAAQDMVEYFTGFSASMNKAKALMEL